LSKSDVIEMKGKVVEALPNAMFQVELAFGKASTTLPFISITSLFDK